jgi:predicted DNA-binding ribbon-helix-helix protein
VNDAIQKRSVTIAGHATSVSLEEEFWTALRQIARRRGIPLAGLVASVDGERDGNLSSALRLLVLESYRSGEIGRD